MSTTTFDEVLTAVAEKQAKGKEDSAGLIDPGALKTHLRLASVLAGCSLVLVLCLASATRLLPMTDKQLALVSVVALTAAGLFVIALLSAGSATASAFARQRLLLHETLQQQERLLAERRQAEIDAAEESARNLETSFAIQVGADVLWAELQGNPALDKATAEQVYRYMRLMSTYNSGSVDRPHDRVALSEAGCWVFHRYQTVLRGKLVEQPLFQRMRQSFEHLKTA